MKRLTITTFLALASCAKIEEGIDTTLIRGNIVITQATFEEPADDGETANDTWATATELPMLTYRRMTVTGTAKDFGTIEEDVVQVLGNSDYYTIAAKDDGTLSMTVDIETSQGLGRDKTILLVYLYDLDNAEEACTTSYSCVATDCGCSATYDEGSAQCVEGDGCTETCTWEIAETETCLPVAAAGGSSDDTLGHMELSLPVVFGGNYGVEIVAGDSSEYEDPAPYTFSFEALTPTDDLFLVGAYESQDVTAHGNPLGGASVYDMQWDEANGVWTGKFEIVHIKKVETEDIDCVIDYGCDCDCDCAVSYDDASSQCVAADTCAEECTCEITEEEICDQEHTVTEGAPKVWLMGGTWPTLNAAIPSGALYSSTAVEVETGDGDDLVGTWGLDTANPDDGDTTPVDTADTAAPAPEPLPLGEIVVYMDALQPRVIGWEHTEVDDGNEVTVNEADYSAVAEEMGNAELLPIASGPGFVDIVYGSASLVDAAGGWSGNPNDFFALSFEQDMSATISLAWDDCSTDLDLHLYDDEGGLWAVSWYACPEIMSTVDWEVPVTAGSTWYVAVLPYTGTVADHPYTVEIEYGAP